MRLCLRLAATLALTLVAGFAPLESAQTVTVDHAIGRWRSVEQFESEPRYSIAFKQDANGISGWAVLLGQTRKGDNRATLALTFYGAKWDKDRVRFETMLPEDGGTIGWELRPTGANSAKLSALTEDGEPMDEPLTWDMVR
jgi:hypothetical protein